MKQMSATQAKQAFGQLLADAALAPVAIERHDRTVAVVVSPQYFAQQAAQGPAQAQRLAARQAQAQRERDRLMRHQSLAITLLTSSKARRLALLQAAGQQIERWESQQLCSPHYIDQWRHWLALPVDQLALAMVSDADGWGSAMRQNSPWLASASP